MNLQDYLQRRGAATELARHLGVRSVMLSQWRYGIKQVPAERCIEIEKGTAGAVRCEELRPDLDWAYLRATDCDIAKVGAGETATEARQEAE